MGLFRRLAVRARRRRRALLAALIAVILVAGLVADQVIRAQVRSTRAEAAEARDERDAARVELASARGDLLRSQTRLAVVTVRRNELREQAEYARALLDQVQGNTTSTVREILLNAPQIEALTHCLNGVSSALNQSSVADPGALATLTAAERTCADARALSRPERRNR